MHWEFTNHALERLTQRYGILHDAEEKLRELCAVALPLRDKTRSGHTVYRAGDVRLICSVEGTGRDLKGVVVTVLPPGDAVDEGDGVIAATFDFSSEAARSKGFLEQEAARLAEATTRAERVAGALRSALNKVQKALAVLNEESQETVIR